MLQSQQMYVCTCIPFQEFDVKVNFDKELDNTISKKLNELRTYVCMYPIFSYASGIHTYVC